MTASLTCSKQHADHSSEMTKSRGEWVRDFVLDLGSHDPNLDIKLVLPLERSHR